MSNITTHITRTILLTCACLLLSVANVRAASWTVTTTQDTNDAVCNADCSLRDAIYVAADGDIINFSALFNTPQVINFVYGTIYINHNVTILGPGADVLTVSDAISPGVFSIPSGSTVTLSGMTVTNTANYSDTTIRNSGNLTILQCNLTENFTSSAVTNYGTLSIHDSTISENSGIYGGGIQNFGDLTLVNSTVSNNTAFGDLGGSESAGGIFSSGDTLTITNSTISGNRKADSSNGGGIWTNSVTVITNSTVTNNYASGVFSRGSSVTIRSSIVAANVGNSVQPDIDYGLGGGFISGGYNLIGNDGSGAFTNVGDQAGTGAAPLDPMLDPLSDYGGMTATHRLQSNSPAIDKGKSFGWTTDQRGFTRPFDKAHHRNAPGGDGSDIGAYEMQFAVAITGAVFDPNGIPLLHALVFMRSSFDCNRFCTESPPLNVGER